jgi:cold shock CspA family protein
MDGVVFSYSRARGFGFVEPSIPADNVFVHHSALPQGHKYLIPGTRISFDLGTDGRGRACAANVVILSEPQDGGSL